MKALTDPEYRRALRLLRGEPDGGFAPGYTQIYRSVKLSRSGAAVLSGIREKAHKNQVALNRRMERQILGVKGC